jgi:hypothetical protein
MSGRRVARRVALRCARQNPRGDAVRVRTLATKVLHCSFSSFSRGGDASGQWRLDGAELRMVIRRRSGEPSLAGGAVVRGSLSYLSCRVTRMAGRNTAHHVIFGNEMKKNRHKGVT